MNILSIHLPDKPNAEQCATALRIIFVLAGANVFNEACNLLPSIPGLGDIVAPVNADDAGFQPVSEAGRQISEQLNSAPSATSAIFDSKGLPWDERIHSGTKGTNQDGSWKKRRGVQDAVVAKVEAELRSAPPTPAASAPPPPPNDDIPASLDRRAPPSPPAASAPPPPPAASGPAADLPKLMQKVTPLMAAKKITMVDIQTMCQELGFPSLVDMNKSPDKATYFPMLDQMIDAKVAA